MHAALRQVQRMTPSLPIVAGLRGLCTAHSHVNVSTGIDQSLGCKAWLGCLLIATDHATELEMRKMLPNDVACFVSRVRNRMPCTVETLAEMEDDIARAASLLLPGSRMDSLIFACTSGAITIGSDRVRELMLSGRACGDAAQLPTTDPRDATVAALRSLGVQRVAVLTPYVKEVNTTIAAALEAADMRVEGFSSFLLEHDVDMSGVQRGPLLRAGLQAAGDAEALFLCCTALRTSAVLQPLEDALQRPVISSHSAMLWHALQMCGYDTSGIRGFGSLFQHSLNAGNDGRGMGR